MTDTQVALWYFRYHNAHVALENSEQDAANYAIWMEDEGEGVPKGIQRPDGTYTPMRDWETYRTERAAADVRQKAEQEAWANTPPTPTRNVKTPFTMKRDCGVSQHWNCNIPAEWPTWIGQQP